MKKFKVVFTDYTYQNLDIEREILNHPDIQLFDYQFRSEDDVISVASDCDILVVQYSSITRKVINSLTNCKMIIRYAIGVDNIDLEAATEKGIYVANVPDYGIDEVSTHAVALLLAAIRKLPQTIHDVHNSKWDYSLVKPLHRTKGTTLGLIGLGRIPCAVAKKMGGFDLNIIAYDPYANKLAADAAGVKLVDFDYLIRTSDYISIHCPLTNETH
ncbi:MAG: C-terminal binding protein, partial [Oscillospiraceae bacterium]